MKRTDFSRVKKKTDAKSVRFKQDLFERIQKEYNVKTGQQVLDVFEMVFERLYIGLPGNPVLERNAPEAKAIIPVSIPKIKEQSQESRAEEVPVLDFGDATFLQVEKFTKYPLYEKPAGKLEATKYMEKKSACDEAIRQQWLKHKKLKGI